MKENENAMVEPEIRMENGEKIEIMMANESHYDYVDTILDTVKKAAKARGTGIASRTHDYILSKIKEKKGIIAFVDGVFAGFCYIETWSGKKFVANSGLIVAPEFRGRGLAKHIKRKAFELSRKRYPEAKLFGITTGLAVMKINSEIGYRPVTFSELTDDPEYWKECEHCVNFDVLSRNNYTRCLCTGMLYDPEEHKDNPEPWKKWAKGEQGEKGHWMRTFKKIISLPFAVKTHKTKGNKQ